MTLSELMQRLSDKYLPLMTSAEAADLADTARNSGTYLAVAGLLKRGLARGDLDIDEASAALREARAGTFRHLSEYLADRLQQYLNGRAA